MATVHPYKGYLNTQFHLYATGTEEVSYDIFDTNSEQESPVFSGVFSPNIPHTIKLRESGSFSVKFSDGTASEITVEDGYKFGGSAYKTSFIFDETPWCFVIMNDRTYFYNRDTEAAYVETISPDFIKVISSDYVLFINNGQNERTVYSLVRQKPILNVTDIVYYNSDVIVWKENTDDNSSKLVIYSLQEQTIQKTILVDQYIVDDETNSVIFINDHVLHKQEFSLPLNNIRTYRICGQLVSLVAPNIAICVDQLYNSSNICVFDTRDDNVVSRLNITDAIATINTTSLIDINERIDAIKQFDINQIGCNEARIKATYGSYMLYPTKWDIFCVIKEQTYERGIKTSNNATTYRVKSLITNSEFTLENDINKVTISDKVICFSNYRETLIFGESITPEYSKDSSIYTHNNDVVRTLEGVAYVLDNCCGWKPLDDAKFSYRYFHEYGIIKNEDTNSYFDLSGRTFTGYAYYSDKPFLHLSIGNQVILQDGTVIPSIKSSLSASGRIGLSVESDGIFLMTIRGEKTVRKNILSDLYDTSSYKSVLLSEDGSQIMYRDEKQTIILDVHSNNCERFDNVSYIKDINGIRPLFSHRAGSLQPRLVDPVTGQILSHHRIPAYQFVSPNGVLYADTEIKKYEETWNKITNTLLSDAEISEFANRFFYVVGSDKETSKANEKNRRHFIENNLQFFKEATQNWVKRGDAQLVDSLCRLPYEDFAKLFMERRGVAYIRNKSNDAIVAKIDLGNPLWYLNYVSFSYDNRYVAIAGRYPNHSNYGGLFLVYDLINKQEIIAKRNSWAVWMTSFNIQNHVAAYSSEPISYDSILLDSDDNTVVDSYPKYSFLTFSPSGEYAALSNQGYVSKYDKYGNERLEWGHMPSCEVYVVNSLKFDTILFKFSDLSKSGIDGLSDKDHNCPKTVTSVSFSNDNKRLMMVGNDGVVVIRNLHL